MKNPFSRLAIVAATVLMSSASLAQTSSSASITNVRYELIDLDPTDGVTPSISFTYYSGVSTFTAPEATGSFTLRDMQESQEPTPSLYSQIGSRGADVVAIVEGRSLMASGYTDGPGSYLGGSGQRGTFSLTANTGLRVSAHATAFRSGVLDLPHLLTSNVTMTISATDLFPGSAVAVYTKNANSLDGTAPSIDEDFVLYFANSASTAIDGMIDSGVDTYGSVLAVPEPATYGTMLLGLGLIGALASRRSAANRAARA